MTKAILIGATSGIGNQLAKLLVNKGYKVGATGRRKNLLIDLKNTNPDLFFIKEMDVVDTNLAIKKLEELILELGGLDLCILSFGIGELNDNLSFEAEKSTIDTNVTGFTAIVDWAFHYFERQDKGHLAIITSVGGLRGSSYAPAYTASKAYQINYLEGLRQKTQKTKSKVIISDIRPGFVDTAMAKGPYQFWVSSTNKAAKQIFTAIKQKRKVAYITKRWELIAMLLKIMPRNIYSRG